MRDEGVKGLRKRCDLSERGVRFGMVHAKDGKGRFRDEGVKGLRKRGDLSERGVRFGIFHAKSAKEWKEFNFF